MDRITNNCDATNYVHITIGWPKNEDKKYGKNYESNRINEVEINNMISHERHHTYG